MNSVLISGGEVSDAHTHSLKDMPFMIAGRANGKFKTGKIVETSKDDFKNSHSRVLASVLNAYSDSLELDEEENTTKHGPLVL